MVSRTIVPFTASHICCYGAGDGLGSLSLMPTFKKPLKIQKKPDPNL